METASHSVAYGVLRFTVKLRLQPKMIVLLDSSECSIRITDINHIAWFLIIPHTITQFRQSKTTIVKLPKNIQEENYNKSELKLTKENTEEE